MTIMANFQTYRLRVKKVFEVGRNMRVMNLSLVFLLENPALT